MKVIIITGASEGIGRELAIQIAQKEKQNVALVLAARRANVLNELAEELQTYGAQTLVVPTDVTHQTTCIRLIEKTVERFGQIDVLVHNAGMSAHANFKDITAQDFAWYEKLMVLNYWSVVWLTHAALPYLLASRGLIVGMSSVAGLTGVPGRTAYCSTKFAMNGFLEALRAELAPKGLRIMLAYPGIVATNIRKQGYAKGGSAPGISMARDDRAMPVETCVRMVIKGMDTGKRDVLMSFQMKVGRWLRLIAPSIPDKMAMKGIKEEYRP